MQQRCGHLSRAEPHRTGDDQAWQGAAIGEQRLLTADERRGRARSGTLRHHPAHQPWCSRTPITPRGYALLASVIETCRLRVSSVIDLLAKAIDAARRGLPAPGLAAIPG